jgi:hypothetical protein
MEKSDWRMAVTDTCILQAYHSVPYEAASGDINMIIRSTFVTIVYYTIIVFLDIIHHPVFI